MPANNPMHPVERWAAFHAGAGALGFPPCTAEYAALFGLPRRLLHGEIEAQLADDITTLICALPERLQTALLAELTGGSVAEKADRAGMSRSTFYRTLAEAKAALRAV
jgi:DNA-directed RNA polymerase specialized sigma24 family protein